MKDFYIEIKGKEFYWKIKGTGSIYFSDILSLSLSLSFFLKLCVVFYDNLQKELQFAPSIYYSG